MLAPLVAAAMAVADVVVVVVMVGGDVGPTTASPGLPMEGDEREVVSSRLCNTHTHR
jgi:hypothetical protein